MTQKEILDSTLENLPSVNNDTFLSAYSILHRIVYSGQPNPDYSGAELRRYMQRFIEEAANRSLILKQHHSC